MNNTKVLEMINEGRIDELKALLQDEIYNDELRNVPGAKQRYSAMKKYFSYNKSTDGRLKHPCVIDNGRTAFSNGFSLIVTNESCGEMELYDDIDSYFDIDKFITYEGDLEEIDVAKIIAKAKSKGYKPKRAEVDQSEDFKYVLKYKDMYYKIGLIDISYGIINDGKKANVYKITNGMKTPITIKTDIGSCMILPLGYRDERFTGKTIIEVA